MVLDKDGAQEWNTVLSNLVKAIESTVYEK